MHYFHAGNSSLQYCRSDFHWPGCGNAWKCGNEYCVSAFYFLYGNLTVAWNRQCDQFFIKAWCRRRKRICRVCGKWNLPDGNFRDCTFCSNDDFADSNAEILRCYIGGTSVCTGIYTNHGNWLSISDRKYGDE